MADTVHKLTRTGIRDAFAGGWHVDSIQPSTIDITAGPGGVRLASGRDPGVNATRGNKETTW